MKRLTITDPHGLLILNKVDLSDADAAARISQYSGPGYIVDSLDITTEENAKKLVRNQRRALLRNAANITTLAQAKDILKAIIDHLISDLQDEA